MIEIIINSFIGALAKEDRKIDLNRILFRNQHLILKCLRIAHILHEINSFAIYFRNNL